MMRLLLASVIVGCLLTSPHLVFPEMRHDKSTPSAQSVERHLANIRQLTFGRQNAEAYFSFSGAKLIFQSTNNWMANSFAGSQSAGVPDLGC